MSKISLYNRSLQILTDADMHISILTIFYILLINSRFSYEVLLKTLVLIVTIAMYLSYVFFINDYCDMPYDIKAGKRRLVQDIPLVYSRGIILGMITISFFIAIFIMRDTLYTLLYAITYFIGTFYSAPPFRFKDRKTLGIFADVLTERTLPLILIITFFRYFEWDALLLLIAFSFFQLELIVHHQIEDYDADLTTGINTFVVEIGREKALYLLNKFIQPLTGLLISSSFIVIAYKMGGMGILALLLLLGYLPTWFVFGLLKEEEKVIPLYLKYLFVLSVNVLPFYVGLVLMYRFHPYIILFLIFCCSIYPDLSRWKDKVLKAD